MRYACVCISFALSQLNFWRGKTSEKRAQFHNDKIVSFSFSLIPAYKREKKARPYFGVCVCLCVYAYAIHEHFSKVECLRYTKAGKGGKKRVHLKTKRCICTGLASGWPDDGEKEE